VVVRQGFAGGAIVTHRPVVLAIPPQPHTTPDAAAPALIGIQQILDAVDKNIVGDTVELCA
jgi:hypothetical protein